MAITTKDLPLTCTKLRNHLEAECCKRGIRATTSFANRRCNGKLEGCYGHITNIDNRVCVCVLADRGVYRPSDVCYRIAKDKTDHRGSTNMYCPPEDIVSRVVDLLEKGEKEWEKYVHSQRR